MKLYTLFSPSHLPLYRDWFVPSLQDEFELIAREAPQVAEDGVYMAQGWLIAMRAKVRLIIEACQQTDGEPFIHSDVDVQFFAPVKPAIERALANVDIVFQRDDPGGMICCGFFAARPSPKLARLFSDVLTGLESQSRLHDQNLINRTLIKRAHAPRPLIRLAQESWRIGLPAFHVFPKLANDLAIKWDYLPASFQSGGTLTGKPWKPGDAFRLAEPLLLHHANWTTGVDAKIAQLKLVKRLHEARR